MNKIVLFGIEFTYDALIQTGGTIIGAFIGTWLAGFFTLKSIKNQISYDREKELKRENEKFLKQSDTILFWSEDIAKILTEIQTIKIINGEYEKLDNALPRLHWYLSLVHERIELNDDNIPREIFDEYLAIKESFHALKLTIENSTKISKEEVLKSITDVSVIFLESLNSFKEYRKEKELLISK